MIATRRVVFVLMDGARPDVLRHLLDRGDLPNLSRHVIEPGGLRVGTTVFPSTTVVAYVPFLQGLYPGRSNIPGVRWLDRGEAAGSWRGRWRAARSYCGVQAGWVNDDLADRPSLFELVPESWAINSPITRDLLPGRHLIGTQRAILGGLAHYAGTYAWFDAAVRRAWHSLAPREWRFLFVVFTGIDGLSHFTEPWHPSVLEAYRTVDRALGRFAELAAGSGEPPLYVVTSDHGLGRVPHHSDVAEHLEARGLPTIRHPVHVWRRNAQAAVMVSGNASVQIYLDPCSGRQEPWQQAEMPPWLLDWACNLPGVELAAWRHDEGVVVSRGSERARLEDDGDRVRYRPLDGDPLGLGTEELSLTDRALLARSRATPYPDAPRQLLQLFESPRAGDLVLSARDGWDFRGPWEIPEHRAGHGSLSREHMDVPIAVSVPLPDVPLRTVDLMPLMAHHLGVEVPPDVDGRVPAAPAAAAVE